MEGPARGDLVCLHLAEHVDHGDGAVPVAVTPAGIADAVGLDDERIDDRLALLATIDELKADGLVDESVRSVEGADGPRNVYFPTRAGRERAAAVRERVADEPVVVADGTGTERVPVERAASYFEDGSLVDVLARLDDGRLTLRGDRDRSFVDREAVLAAFEDALDATRERGGRTRLVVGAAGVGKTLLLDEVADRAAEREFEVLSGAARRDVLDPYGPLRRAFEGALDGGVVDRLADADGIEDSEARSDSGSRVEPGDAGGPEGSTEPSIAGALEDAAAFEAGRNALFYEVREALTDRATEGPLLVVVDDLQWADGPTLELFAYLAESVTEWIYPVLFVAAYRPEVSDEDDPLVATLARLTGADRVERLHLDPLEAHHTRILLGDLTGDPAVPEGFVDLVQRTTGGNPLFVRALVSKLLDAGVVDPTADEYPVDEGDLDVPAAVREAVEERLASLDEPGRRVLRAGSVLGETVPRDLLVPVVDRPAPDVLGYADLLVGAGVWERTPEGYRFDSGVIREAVRSGLPDEVAAGLHEAAATALASRDEGDGGDAAAIARHNEAAGDRERALEHYRRAGEHAESVYAHEVAREAYGSAVALARDRGDAPAEAELLERLAEVRFLLGEFAAAAAAFEQLRGVTDDPAATVRAHHRSGEIRVKQGDYDAALAHAEDGLALAEADDVPAADRCGLLRMRGWALMQRGDLAAARETFERERAAADRAGADAALGVALHDLGTVAGKSGEFDDAEGYLADAVERLEAVGDRRHLAKALTNLALVHRHVGELDAAAEEIRRALDIQREVGVEEGLPTTLLNLGVVHEARGELAAAIERYRGALAAARRVGRDQKAANARADLAEALCAVGEVPEGREHAERAVAVCEEMGHRDGEAMARAARARLRLVAGDLSAARQSAEAALRIAREVGNKDRVGDALAVRGQVHRFEGDPGAARECHEEGLALMEETGNADLAIANRVGLAGDRQAAGELDAALEHAETALGAASHDDVLRSRIRVRVGAIQRERSAFDEAEAALSRGLALQRDRGARTYETRTLLELAELELARGDTGAAREYVDEAADLAAACGAELYVRRAEELRTAL